MNAKACCVQAMSVQIMTDMVCCNTYGQYAVVREIMRQICGIAETSGISSHVPHLNLARVICPLLTLI